MSHRIMKLLSRAVPCFNVYYWAVEEVMTATRGKVSQKCEKRLPVHVQILLIDETFVIIHSSNASLACLRFATAVYFNN